MFVCLFVCLFVCFFPTVFVLHLFFFPVAVFVSNERKFEIRFEIKKSSEIDREEFLTAPLLFPFLSVRVCFKLLTSAPKRIQANKEEQSRAAREAEQKRDAEIKKREDEQQRAAEAAKAKALADEKAAEAAEAERKRKKDAEAKRLEEEQEKRKRELEEKQAREKRDAEEKLKATLKKAETKVEPAAKKPTGPAQVDFRSNLKSRGGSSAGTAPAPASASATTSAAAKPAEKVFEDPVAKRERERKEQEAKRKKDEEAELSRASRATSAAAGSSELENIGDHERKAYMDYINLSLSVRPDAKLASILPLTKLNFTRHVADGILPCKLINFLQRDTLDDRALNYKINDNRDRQENMNLCVNSARMLGVRVSHLSIDALIKGDEAQCWNLVWVIIKGGFAERVRKFKEKLATLAGRGTSVEDLQSLPAEEILIRWMNKHVSAFDMKVANLDKDVADCISYVTLLNAIDESSSAEALDEDDLAKRAHMVIDLAAKITPLPRFFVASEIAAGNPRQNFLFAASLFAHLKE